VFGTASRPPSTRVCALCRSQERSGEAAAKLGGLRSSRGSGDRVAAAQAPPPKSWADQVDDAFGDWAD
jgi:hypothetical protein